MLAFALFQKSIVDILEGILLATSGLSMYLAFDFITFSETLNNNSERVVNGELYKFGLQGNAKLAILS